MLSSMRLEIQAQEDARDIGLETMQPVDHGPPQYICTCYQC